MKTQRDYLQPEACSLQPASPALGLPTACGLQPTVGVPAGRLLYTLSNGEHGYTAVTRIYADRLGSTRATQTQEWVWNSSTTRNYYPYGEEIGSTSNDQYKYASTYRDSATGLDYAINRYYASGTARFLTPDPYQASGGPANPQSWNRYAYSLNDPANFSDPAGLSVLSAIKRWLRGNGDEGGGDDGEYVWEPAPEDYVSSSQKAKTQSLQEASRKAKTRQQWMFAGRNALESFTTDSEPCQEDLTALGLTTGDVQRLAKAVKLVNIRSVPPSTKAGLQTGGDFYASTDGSNTVIYDMGNAWQNAYGETLGTLVHEFAHLNDPKSEDTDFQKALGLDTDPKNHSNIGMKLADDCFKGAKAPE